MINVRDTFQKIGSHRFLAGALAYTGLVAKRLTIRSPRISRKRRRPWPQPEAGDLGQSLRRPRAPDRQFELRLRRQLLQLRPRLSPERRRIYGGVDAIVSGLTGPNDALIVGGFGGFHWRDGQLERGWNVRWFSGGNVGVYGTYFNGPLFVDLIGKVDPLALNIAGSASRNPPASELQLPRQCRLQIQFGGQLVC